MTTFRQFWLDHQSKIVPLDLIEISHPNFTKTYRIVRNKIGGGDFTIDGAPQTFEYYPLRITPKSTRANLDYGEQIDLGDVGQIVPVEVDAIAAADGWGTKIKVRRWIFRSDDLTTPIWGPYTMETRSLPMKPGVTSFVASAPSLNMNRTGELYLPGRFPMLEGFI